VGEAGLEPTTPGLEVPAGPFSAVYDWLVSKSIAKVLGRSNAMHDYCGDILFPMETPHSFPHRKAHRKMFNDFARPLTQPGPPSDFRTHACRLLSAVTATSRLVLMLRIVSALHGLGREPYQCHSEPNIEKHGRHSGYVYAQSVAGKLPIIPFSGNSTAEPATPAPHCFRAQSARRF
jgi:hypothetical protein